MKLVLGIDGGGTSLRTALAPARPGAWLGTASAGAGNARSVPEPELTARLAEVVESVLPAGRGGEVAAVVAGFAGAGMPGQDDDAGQVKATRALKNALRAQGIHTDAVSVIGDVEIAFAAAPGTPRDGLAVIAGTGAAAARIRNHRLITATDSCGWLAGDDGSGFWIAREGVRRALRALDGRGPATILVHRLAEAFGAAAPDTQTLRITLVDAALSMDPPVRLARYCPVVVQAAEDGDQLAEAILDEAADLIAETTTALCPLRGEPLVTVGGLLGPQGPLLNRFAARVSGLGLTPYPVADGLAGAVALARARARARQDIGNHA